VKTLLSAGVDAIWITTAPGIVGALPAKKNRTLLGQETDAIVFDAHSGFDVNAFAAISGTLRGGGTFYLLTPPLDEWAGFADPDYRRFLPYPYQPEDANGRFLRRFVGMLEGDSPPIPNPSPARGEGSHVSQQDAVETVVMTEFPVVLTADRGRGKSAALGMASSQLIAAGNRVLLTAPSRATVESVFKHAENPPDFFAPDDLLQTLPKADVLMVDEAAAIPVPLLLNMLEHYPRCVFSTTLHGYEGSGRGFALRFQKQLDVLAPGWQSIRLHQPIRWAENDPLERFINHALLLDVDLAPCPPCGGRVREGGGDTQYRQLNRDTLAQKEPLLRQLFGLLVTAHYQTRPSDLRQMLDAPDISIHILEQDEIILAVALLSREGGLDADLTAAIHAGKRRPHGHPVPQTLTFHAGIAGAAQLVCERVMRIAVHPALQNKGLGTQLLEHLLGFAAQQQADYLGVSYAMTDALLHFWERAGFVTARIGHRKDTASGSHSVVQVRALSDRAKVLFKGL
jgi:tRNA(Met) cytidine acetyltransferase